jgi:hypothetical protein
VPGGDDERVRAGALRFFRRVLSEIEISKCASISILLWTILFTLGSISVIKSSGMRKRAELPPAGRPTPYHTRPTGYDTRAGATVLIRGYLFAATKRWLYKDSSVAKVKSMDHKLILQDNCITAETYGLESRCSGAERGIEGTGVSGVGTGASLGPRGDISVILLDDETYQKIL